MTRLPSFPPPANRRRSAADVSAAAAPTVPVWRSGAILLLALAVAIVCWLRPNVRVLPHSGVVMQLPTYINLGSGFFGVDAAETPAERNILPKDTEFARKNYFDTPGKDQIFCSIVLSGASQQSIHRPEVCLKAQGWQITNQQEVPIRLASGRLLTVSKLTIQRSGRLNGVPVTVTAYDMYWFVGEKITTPYHLSRVLISSWDRIVHGRAHRWAYVTVLCRVNQDLVPGGLDAKQTQDLMVEFIRRVVPYFQKSEMTAPVSS